MVSLSYPLLLWNDHYEWRFGDKSMPGADGLLLIWVHTNFQASFWCILEVPLLDHTLLFIDSIKQVPKMWNLNAVNVHLPWTLNACTVTSCHIFPVPIHVLSAVLIRACHASRVECRLTKKVHCLLVSWWEGSMQFLWSSFVMGSTGPCRTFLHIATPGDFLFLQMMKLLSCIVGVTPLLALHPACGHVSSPHFTMEHSSLCYFSMSIYLFGISKM